MVQANEVMTALFGFSASIRQIIKHVLLKVNMRIRGVNHTRLRSLCCSQGLRAGFERLVYESASPYQSKIDMVKLLRVYGGCLGAERR